MALQQHVFVHIWDDNANVYGSRKAAIEGIASNHDEHETAVVAAAVDEAAANPGEAAYIDGGMSTVRHLAIGY
jgi:hypothetical protein